MKARRQLIASRWTKLRLPNLFHPREHHPSNVQSRCYELVRQERLIVGPSTAPYPINHETIISSSDSVAELNALRDRIAGSVSVSESADLSPEVWTDKLPGHKSWSYNIRRM